MTISVIKATDGNLEDVFEIIKKCQELLKKQGSPQWSNEDAPTISSIKKAINSSLVYILIIKDKIVGTAILTEEKEEAYSTIQYGSWAGKENSYFSIHRFAISPEEGGKGYAKLFFKLLTLIAIENGARDIRVDTYPENRPMQKVILSCGFEFRGIVRLPFSNGERYAYQKIDFRN